MAPAGASSVETKRYSEEFSTDLWKNPVPVMGDTLSPAKLRQQQAKRGQRQRAACGPVAGPKRGPGMAGASRQSKAPRGCLGAELTGWGPAW